MRRLPLLLAVVLIFGIQLSLSNASKGGKQEKKDTAQKSATALPEDSLDALFPPKAKEPVFLFSMFGMGTYFSGMVSDLFENDVENVKVDFEKFKAQYIQTSKLVPEWEKNFPLGPVEELGKALESGDQGVVMQAFEKAGKVCFDCHVANMARVQQRYHWGDFQGIKIKDPLTNEDVNFTQLMQYIDASMAGIHVDLEQGQIENAQKQFQGFNARFQAMKDTCGDCHGTDERKYYTDDSVQSLVDELGQALGSTSVDPESVGKLFMAIGIESCHKCHLVHAPAALAKYQ